LKQNFTFALIVIIVINLISLNLLIQVYAEKTLPPLRQIRNGVLSENIVCPDNFVLMQKQSKNEVACVKPQTSLKLTENGWARIEKVVVFFIDKTEYKIGENITITMKNMGQKTIQVGGVPVGFTIVDEKGKVVCTWQGVAEAIGIIRSNATITQIWDQKDCTTEKQVKSGIYSVTFGYHISNLKPFRIIN